MYTPETMNVTRTQDTTYALVLNCTVLDMQATWTSENKDENCVQRTGGINAETTQSCCQFESCLTLSGSWRREYVAGPLQPTDATVCYTAATVCYTTQASEGWLGLQTLHSVASVRPWCPTLVTSGHHVATPGPVPRSRSRFWHVLTPRKAASGLLLPLVPHSRSRVSRIWNTM